MIFFSTGELKLEDRWLLNLNVLSWTQHTVKDMYWRSCYSYILCTLVGAFEGCVADGGPHKRTMVLTGTQGTGKSTLGAFIAWVLAHVFKWKVTYKWGAHSHTTGNLDETQKVITVWDASLPGGEIAKSTGGHLLIVSSCNNSRWEQVAQQAGSFGGARGDIVFIDTAPLPEIEEMAKHYGHNLETVKSNFDIAGGVARLCLDTDVSPKPLVDLAFDDFQVDFVGMTKNLLALQDKLTEKKVYPGLLLHFHPKLPHRNEAYLRAGSPYIRDKLRRFVEEQSEAEISSLLDDLLSIKKAHGFAGLIWEPLFTKKARKQEGNLVIAGCTLPATHNNVTILLEENTSNLYVFEFKTDEELKDGVDAWRKSDTRCCLAKARSDNYVAIDAILFVRVDENNYIAAALQMTVASETHVLIEAGIIKFVNLMASFGVEWTATFISQIWFLQPESSLKQDFAFVKLQALVFENDRLSSGNATARDGNTDTTRRASKRVKRVPDKFGDWDYAMNPRRQSNNKVFWDISVREIPQYVAVARFHDTNECDRANRTLKKRQGIADALQAALNSVDEAQANTHVADPVPPFRTLEYTNLALQNLETGLPKVLIDLIKDDIADEEPPSERAVDEVGEQTSGS